MNHPPAFDLDRFAAKDLDPAETSRVQGHLQECPKCQQALAGIEDERKAMISRLSPPQFAALVDVRASLSDRRAWGRPLVIWSLAGAGVAAALLAVVLLAPWADHQDQARWMGSAPTVRIYLNRNGSTMTLTQEHLQIGDRLRYEVTLPPGKKGYAALVAVEATNVFPVLTGSNQADPIRVSDTSLLPGSVAVESGSEPTLLCLIFRPEPYSMNDLIREVGQARLEKKLDSMPGLIHQLLVEAGPQ